MDTDYTMAIREIRNLSLSMENVSLSHFCLATSKVAQELQRKEEGENWGVKLKLLRK